MKTLSYVMTLFAVLFVGCVPKTGENEQQNEASGLEPLAYTIYTEKLELFVEFKPLIVGSKSNFAAHFTLLGETFLPLSEGKVTVSLILGEKGIRNTADSPSVPGIFRLALMPLTSGTGKLVFDIESKNFTDRITIDSITVHPDREDALERHAQPGAVEGITYLKEQAWKVEFANSPVRKQSFHSVIHTTGNLQSAPGDERLVTAGADGIVLFSGLASIVGAEVSQGTSLFTVVGGDLTSGNTDTRYMEAKAAYEKAKANYERAQALITDKIISQKEFLEAKTEYETTRVTYNALAKNYTGAGQTVRSPMKGYIKNVFVKEGQFVQAGTPLATVSVNRKLLLQANLSQKYFDQMSSIHSANFKISGSSEVYDTDRLSGKILSYGKSVSSTTPFVPILFEISNTGNLIPGAVAEVFLKSFPIPGALVIPVTSLIEEQGTFYVYVQTEGERFEKREVGLGANDGQNVQVLTGLTEGERIVTKGAYQIKLSQASGTLPAHGHEH